MTISSKYITNIKHFKNTTWYLKRRTNNNKRVAKLVVQHSGTDKGSYTFSLFRGNGTREIVYYDAKRQKRSVFIQKNKHAKEELQYVLHKSHTENGTWIKNILTADGDKLSFKVYSV